MTLLSLQKLCATNSRSVKEQKNTHTTGRRRGGVQWRPPTRACARSGGRGRRRRGRRTSMAAALGDVGSRGGALGGDVDGGGARGARAVGGAGERTAGGRKGEGGRKLGNIWGGPFVPGEATTRDKRAFCLGWWLHPGQKAPTLYITHSSAFLQHLVSS